MCRKRVAPVSTEKVELSLVSERVPVVDQHNRVTKDYTN